MSLEGLYENCGLLATFIGTLLEGELSMLTSILGAKMGYYSYSMALVFGFLGAWIADWFKFLVGRTKGKKILERKPKLQAKFDKASTWFDKYPYWVLSFYKLFFGMTTIILIMAGLKNISYFRFAIHTAFSTALWVAVLGGFGYFCAEAMIMNINFVSDHKLEALSVIAAAIFLYWFFVKRPRQKACLECK